MTEKLNEQLERVERASHAGKFGLYVGVTLAVLGVLLAFSAAMVGRERTEQIAAMVDQTKASMKHNGLSMKYRLLVAQLRQIHAQEIDPENYKKWDAESKKLASSIANADLAKVVRIVRLENAKTLDAEVPPESDVIKFAALAKAVKEQQKAAGRWVESFEGLVETHWIASEQLERAQVASEIGIVLASIALLLTSRYAWYGSMFLGLVSMAILLVTFVHTSIKENKAEAVITEARARYDDLAEKNQADMSDDDLIRDVGRDILPAINP